MLVLCEKKISIFPIFTIFFNMYQFKQIYFQVQSFFRWNFFLFWMQNIRENFISFRNMFSKNKKRLNWSNNKVKTKNYNFYLNWNILHFLEKLLYHALPNSNYNKIILFIIFSTYGDVRMMMIYSLFFLLSKLSKFLV